MNTAHHNAVARGIGIAATLAAAIIGVTGCSQRDDESSARTVPGRGIDIGLSGAPAATEAPASDGSSVQPPTDVDVVDPILQDRYLAIDVTFGIEVDDMARGVDAVVALAARHGGRIDARAINIADDRSSTASLVIKLPPSEVESTIADLDTVGTRRTVSQGTEDVTSQVVDIDARLATAQASLERVRKLLEAATDLGQVLSLESQLTERETAVEKYQAMKRAIDDRVSLATLRVDLSLSPVPTSKAAPGDQQDNTTIGKAFATGWRGFVTALAAVLIFFGYTAPFIVLLAIGAGLTLPFIRRHQRALRSRAAGPPPPPMAEGSQEDTRPSQPVDVST